jgi:hypothetical protein
MKLRRDTYNQLSHAVLSLNIPLTKQAWKALPKNATSARKNPLT